MKPVSQTIFDADSGNCLSACIASILELPIESVPNFAKEHGDDCLKSAGCWLGTRGLRFLIIAFAHADTFANTFFDCAGEFCIVSGPSSHADRQHAVVGRVNDCGGIEIVHDPIPNGTGPLAGYRWVRFIVPAAASQQPPEVDWPDGEGWWWAYKDGSEGGFCKAQRKWNILWLFFAGISEGYAKGSKESEHELPGYRFRRAVPPAPATAAPQTPADQP